MNGRMAKWLVFCVSIAVGLAGCASGPKARPSSANLIDQLENEMTTGLARRSVRATFDQYQKYASGRLDATAGTNTWRDKTGNCRLSWYDALMRDQLHAPREVELFSREFHRAIFDEKYGLERAFAMAANKLDAKTDLGLRKSPTNAREAI